MASTGTERRRAEDARPNVRFGVDLGGTKIEIAAIGGERPGGRREFGRPRLPPP